MDPDLPDGWTIERVRALSGDARATLLPPEGLVVAEEHGRTDYMSLKPRVILAFGELCLVEAGGEWWMGHLDAAGSIICWATYGSDLAEAIRSL